MSKLTVDQDDDTDMEDKDDLPPSSTNISDTSDSDTPRHKPHLPRSSPGATGRAHMRGNNGFT